MQQQGPGGGGDAAFQTQRRARLAAGCLSDVALTRNGTPRQRRPKQKRYECLACGRRLHASAFEPSRKRPGALMSICMACHYPDAEPQDRAIRATMPYWWDRRPASPQPHTPKPRKRAEVEARTTRPAHPPHPDRLEEEIPDWALPF
jgi:hypothetical protein